MNPRYIFRKLSAAGTKPDLNIGGTTKSTTRNNPWDGTV